MPMVPWYLMSNQSILTRGIKIPPWLGLWREYKHWMEIQSALSCEAVPSAQNASGVGEKYRRVLVLY